MQKFFLTLFTLIIATTLVSAQDNQDAQRSQADETLIRNVGGVIPVRPKEVLSGTPYLSEKFRLGRVLFGENATSEIIEMDYNVYTNQVHYMENGQLMAIDFNQIDGFVFLDLKSQEVIETYRTGEVNQDLKITQNTPLKVIYDGKMKLYEHYDTYVNEIKNSYTGINTKKYVSKSYIVFKDSDGEMKRIKLKKKDFLKHVVDKTYKKEMEQFIKKNDLSMKSEADAQLFLAHYENIISENS
jgi:hypothetical protein